MNLDQVCVAVTRYYGGIKLGTGGLCRAYSGAARELLQQIPLQEMIPMREVGITVPTEFLGVAFHVIENHGGKDVVEEFDEKHGDRFVVIFNVEETEYQAVENHLQESSRGKISLHDPSPSLFS
jgi:putative IMPACT (imprinted ancient) family translation regulator